MLWTTKPDIDTINNSGKGTLTDHLGIEFIEIGDDYMVAKMPVDSRTIQPFRLLHGGASVVLAETLGSLASTLCIDLSKYQPVGIEINANHLRSVREGGVVFGRVTAVRVGRSLHVWQIDITDEKGRLNCVSRLTVSIIEHIK
jgi:1,4-dihydroxy-2-naphthoyl-CoA hydrolase